MKLQKLIRYIVVAFGIGSMLVLVIWGFIARFIARVDTPAGLEELVSTFAFMIWNILPYIAYFFITKEIYSYYLLLPPALLLCSVQLFFIINYLTSLHSTAGLIFIFLPIFEGIVLAFGFILGFFAEKIRNKVLKDKK